MHYPSGFSRKVSKHIIQLYTEKFKIKVLEDDLFKPNNSVEAPNKN